MVRMVCLANSWRPGGRCVAGIDTHSGQWIRPVPPGGGAIPDERTFLQGRHLAMLDVIELDLDGPTFTTRFQRENRQIRHWTWRRVATLAPAGVLRYGSNAEPLLHSNLKVVDPALLERKPSFEWASLQLVDVDNAVFEKDPHKESRWTVQFSLGSGRSYTLPVTDPEATARLKEGQSIGRECLLTISLTAPIEIQKRDLPPLCYKLAAGVIEL